MSNPLHIVINDENWSIERKEALKKILSDCACGEIVLEGASPIEQIQDQLAAGQNAINALVQAGYTYKGNGSWEKPKPNLIQCMPLHQKLVAIEALSAAFEATKGTVLEKNIRKKLEMLVEGI